MYWSPSKWDEATSIQEIGRTEWHRCPLWWPSMCKRWFTHISLLGLWWWNDYGYMRNINQQTIGYINMYIYNTYICTYIYISTIILSCLNVFIVPIHITWPLGISLSLAPCQKLLRSPQHSEGLMSTCGSQAGQAVSKKGRCRPWGYCCCVLQLSGYSQIITICGNSTWHVYCMYIYIYIQTYVYIYI